MSLDNIINAKMRRAMEEDPKAIVGRRSTWNPLKHKFDWGGYEVIKSKEELVDHVIITLDGRMFLMNEKLGIASQINYDPYTGEEAKVRATPR